ncbi:N-acetyl-D-glucosamine kinase [Vanrija pseudolonga]|uniref:N-acetyl-D-glucosamine kinase n=1 Tax=Vanrija pseudolonga TaxID=143232 RepID=A0AAF0YCQ3_9TREE|nr:N-acetyl-D-glucosamine kinase [Vanrija pseudolonga]
MPAMRLERLYLCVDAGGTKVAVAIADHEGSIVAEGFAGPANMAELGVGVAVGEILKAVAQAVAALPSSSSEPASSEPYRCPIAFEEAWVGVSGCDTPTDVARLSAALAPVFPRPVEVMNDALILSLVMRERRAEWCAAVVSGTGSVALGVDAQGQWGKRGGFGFLFGDPGSGYHLGLVAIRRACEAYDEGREVDGVAQLIRERFGAESTDDVPARCHDVPTDLDPVSASNARKLRIAGLAPEVLSRAGSDELAAAALAECAAGLAVDIASLARQAKRDGRVRGGLAITGGLGVQPAYGAALEAALDRMGVQFDWVETVTSPARRGAAALAALHL